MRRLLYIIEKGPESLDAESADDVYLFSNIQELHRRNIELSGMLGRLKNNQEKAIENYHNNE